MTASAQRNQRREIRRRRIIDLLLIIGVLVSAIITASLVSFEPNFWELRP